MVLEAGKNKLSSSTFASIDPFLIKESFFKA